MWSSRDLGLVPPFWPFPFFLGAGPQVCDSFRSIFHSNWVSQPFFEWNAQWEHWRHEEYDGGSNRRNQRRARFFANLSRLGCRWYHRVWYIAYFLYSFSNIRAARPFIGGVLSRPQDRWPSLFSHPFWREYPYFLPSLATSAYSFLAFTTAAIFLKEVGSLRSQQALCSLTRLDCGL